MTDVSPIGRTPPAALGRAAPRTTAAATMPALNRGADKVELSARAQDISRLVKLAKNLPVRQDLIDRVQAEDAAGTYDTPEKIDAILDNLLLVQDIKDAKGE